MGVERPLGSAHIPEGRNTAGGSTPTAVASIAVPPDRKRDARARELVPFVGTWPMHALKVVWGSFEACTVLRRTTGNDGTR
jgi:hypothetical protein